MGYWGIGSGRKSGGAGSSLVVLLKMILTFVFNKAMERIRRAAPLSPTAQPSPKGNVMSQAAINVCGCLLAASSLLSCSSDESDTTHPPAGASRAVVVKNYSANLYAGYSDSVSDAQAFKTAVAAFLASPSEATLSSARDSWLALRAHYMLTEGARFYDGPIDVDPSNDEAFVNSWPLDEAYIDYTTDALGTVDETVGIIS